MEIVHNGAPLRENVAQTCRWGRYVSETEKAAILNAHNLATRPTTALDIGCEGGRWSELLAGLGWKMICTDIDQEVLNICKNRLPAARVVLMHPEDSNLPCDTESVGLVLCVEVTAVLRADWFIEDVYRVLKKGGMVLGVFLNHLSWRGLIKHSIASAKSDFNWYQLSYLKWRRKFCAHGFNMLYEEGFCWPPFRRESNSLLVPVATGIEHYLGLRKLVRFSPWIVFIAQRNEWTCGDMLLDVTTP